MSAKPTLKTERTARLHVLFSDEEKRMLREIAARRGLTPSTAVRLLVRDAYSEGIAAISDAPLPRS